MLHGARSYLLQDEDGQTIESHSISAGLDYPGVGPEHAYLHDIGRAEYRPVTDAEAMEAFALLCRTEGIIPAIESAHALAGALDGSGRELGPDAAAAGQPVRPRRQGRRDRVALVRARRPPTEVDPGPGPGRPTSSPTEGAVSNDEAVAGHGRGGDRHRASWPTRIGKAKAEGRAALIGYLPVGYPTSTARSPRWSAMVEGGADVVEVGVPYSDPGMDGPVIQQAVDVAVRAGVGMRDVLRAVEAVAAAGAVPVVMTYWNPIERYGVERFAADLAAAGGAGVITPDLIPDEAGDVARRRRSEPTWTGSSSSRRRPPTPGCARRPPPAAASSTPPRPWA